MNTIRIHVWSDKSWCFQEELESMLQYRSDDYATFDTPDMFESEEDIKDFVITATS